MDWFLMALVGGSLMLVGPMPERDCKMLKVTIFSSANPVCIERSLIDGKRPA